MAGEVLEAGKLGRNGGRCRGVWSGAIAVWSRGEEQSGREVGREAGAFK